MKRYVAGAAVLLGAALASGGCAMSSTTIAPAGMASELVSTIAGQVGVIGSNVPADSVSALLADFYYPAGMVYVTSTNSIYIADSGNSTIRQLNLTTGQVTTLAGYPGQAGYFDNASNPTLSAYFNSPEGITTDNTYLYVADSGNNVIRRVSLTTGLVDTLAGNEGVSPAGFLDGTGTGAYFNNPLGICYDVSSTSLYVTDSGNSAIRHIATPLTGAANSGVVTTLAGSPTISTFYWPEGIVFDNANGNLYVVDSGYDEVLQVTTGGAVVTLAGSGSKGDADGTGIAAQFNWPEGITIDSTNTYLYVTDTLNSVIRQVTINGGAVTTLAGQGQVPGSADGTGNVAKFNNPMRLAVNGTTIYVSDTYNETIRMIK